MVERHIDIKDEGQREWNNRTKSRQTRREGGGISPPLFMAEGGWTIVGQFPFLSLRWTTVANVSIVEPPPRPEVWAFWNNDGHCLTHGQTTAFE